MTKSELNIVREAYLELTTAVLQMLPADNQIICDRVRRAERLLRALVQIEENQPKNKEEHDE